MGSTWDLLERHGCNDLGEVFTYLALNERQ
jgi:hypothetical protein